MLEELGVRNYALIENLVVRFSRGFNVLTGETGAGKSILIGALGLLIGGRADISAIREGSEETLVTGTVVVAGNREAGEWLREHGIEVDDDAVILRRTVKKSGRGTIYIQSVPVTRAELAEFSALLFDIHGQHDHQSLLSTDNQRKLLDRYAKIEGEVERFYTEFRLFSNLREEYGRVIANEKDRNRQIDFLRYSIEEIDKAKLYEGEEDDLESERKILSNAEKLYSFVEGAYTSTAEGKNGAMAYVRNLRNFLAQAAEIDDRLNELLKRCEDIYYSLEDISEELRSYRDEIQFDPERLNVVEERLALIRSLEKKYGDTTKDVLKYREEAERELLNLENWEDKKAELEGKIKHLELKLRENSERISEARKKGAELLSRAIEEELKHLGMTNARFKVLVEEKKSTTGKPILGPYGRDNVEFLISPNKGEPFKKLKAIASGGELSRVMLAIKTILSVSDHIDTMIFDEVDVGIGGEVAIAVGERLSRLADVKQVLCITHLATIASYADNHIKVEKMEREGRTVTVVKSIDGEERVREIARMLAGDKEEETSLRHARELLEKYGSL